MAAVQPPTLLSLALHEGQPSGGTRFGRLFLVSLALHFGFLSLVGILRLPDTEYHPFAAQDVMLVSIAEAQVIKAPLATRVVEEKPAPNKTAPATSPKPEHKVAPPVPEPVPPPAVPQPELIPEPSISMAGVAEARARSQALVEEALSRIKLPPKPVAKLGATLPPPVTTPLLELPEVPDLSTPSRPLSAKEDGARAGAQIDEVLKNIELPPETPEFENLASLPTLAPTLAVPRSLAERPATKAPGPALPQPRAKQVRESVSSILGDLTVPELPAAPAPLEQLAKAFVRKPHTGRSLSEDVRRDLRAIEKRQRAVPTPPVAEPEVSEMQVARRTAPGEGATSVSKPVISVQATDVPSRWGQYLARVQRKISQHWVAPPVEIMGQHLVVVVKFRLFRSGAVSNISVEDPSGNEYYDLAARRAIISAEPLPSFPRAMPEPYMDAHFTFAVGEQVG